MVDLPASDLALCNLVPSGQLQTPWRTWLRDATVLEPGLVLLRGCIDEQAQHNIARMATHWGRDGEDGFYTSRGNALELNAEQGRGRIYDAASRFPGEFIGLSARASAVASALDPEMPPMECSHVLVNMYTGESDGLVWHRDIYENDGRSDHPVVNLSVGASCVFGIRSPSDGQERHICLHSGDCLLFGGPCRFIEHAVLELQLENRPAWMTEENDACRFSFTFRDSPEVCGREQEFKYFRPSDHLVGQELYSDDVRTLMPAHASQAA
eukprot:COSAG02_NODE_340_length_24179_cov_6.401644_8_plen_268_part_00